MWRLYLGAVERDAWTIQQKIHGEKQTCHDQPEVMHMVWTGHAG
jgi:hypothetical protein